ncbi:MAG: hypothetical protein H0V42_08705 [Nocardioidaceae bacterium]|nr:hypothetical protein [Nocardioidaceae bacterium]
MSASPLATLVPVPTARRRRHRTGRALLILGFAAVMALTGAVPGASAKSPHQVDPNLMTPALNPNFAPWSCFEAGTGITCQGSLHQEYVDEAIGLQCDGQEVYVTGYGDEKMTRWHTVDGLATKTSVHLSYPGDVFSLSPSGDGPTMTLSGQWNRHYVYPVPGDLTSRVLTEVGAIWLVHAAGGGGLVLHDTGIVTFAPGADFEDVAIMHGVHDFYSDPSSLDRLICDTLT